MRGKWQFWAAFVTTIVTSDRNKRRLAIAFAAHAGSARNMPGCAYGRDRPYQRQATDLVFYNH